MFEYNTIIIRAWMYKLHLVHRERTMTSKRLQFSIIYKHLQSNICYFYGLSLDVHCFCHITGHSGDCLKLIVKNTTVKVLDAHQYFRCLI